MTKRKAVLISGAAWASLLISASVIAPLSALPFVGAVAAVRTFVTIASILSGIAGIVTTITTAVCWSDLTSKPCGNCRRLEKENRSLIEAIR